MASIEELKSTVGDGSRAGKQGREILEKAAADAAEALLAHTCHDSRHEEVERALAGLAKVNHEAELTIRRLAAAEEHANAYLAKLE
jgi:hypothetical protein